MVACRWPKTRSAAEGSSPSASADSTTATCWEGVFRRYKGVLRLEVNVVRQVGPRNVWIRSAWPCLPSPKRRMKVSIGDAEVRALLIGAGETLGVHPLRCSPPAFHLAPGAYKRRNRSHTRRRSAGEMAGRAVKWGVWPKETGEPDALGPSS